MFLTILDYLGSLAFCLAGSALAHKVGFSFFGNFITTLVAGFTGGCIRDTFLGYTPPAAFQNNLYFFIALASVLFMHFAVNSSKILEKFVLFGDAVGLAVFAAVSAHKAVESSLGILQCGIIAIIGTCFGGLFRDLIVKEPPFVLVSPLYALCAFLGGVLYYLCLQFFTRDIAEITVILFVFMMRIFTDFDSFFPKIRKKKLVTRGGLEPPT
jgi:uncharacterized membrane protein YeiH